MLKHRIYESGVDKDGWSGFHNNGPDFRFGQAKKFADRAAKKLSALGWDLDEYWTTEDWEYTGYIDDLDDELWGERYIIVFMNYNLPRSRNARKEVCAEGRKDVAALEKVLGPSIFEIDGDVSFDDMEDAWYLRCEFLVTNV